MNIRAINCQSEQSSTRTFKHKIIAILCIESVIVTPTITFICFYNKLFQKVPYLLVLTSAFVHREIFYYEFYFPNYHSDEGFNLFKVSSKGIIERF